jgi:hypothetical protein
MLTAPARSAPDRASVSAAMPPKQKPTAAMGPAASAQPDSAVSPAWARRASNTGSSRRAVTQAMTRSRSPATPSPYMSQARTV